MHQLTVSATSTDRDGTIETATVQVEIMFNGQQCPIVSVHVGVSGGTCATNSEGKFWCWGQATTGRSGYTDPAVLSQRNGDRLTDTSTIPPVPFTPNPDEGKVVEVVGLKGQYASQQAQCLRTSTGSIRCWGSGKYLPYSGGQDIASPNDAPRSYGYGPMTRAYAGFGSGQPHHAGKALRLYAGTNNFCVVLDTVVMLDVDAQLGSNIECWGDLRMFGSPDDIATAAAPGQTHSLGGEIIAAGPSIPAIQASHSIGIGTRTVCWIYAGSNGLRGVHCSGRDYEQGPDTASYRRSFFITLGSHRANADSIKIGADQDRFCAVYPITSNPHDSFAACWGYYIDQRTELFGSLPDEAVPQAQSSSAPLNRYTEVRGLARGIAVMAGGFCADMGPDRWGRSLL